VRHLKRGGTSLVLTVTALVFSAVAARAQTWSGTVAGGYVWQHVGGNENSFRTQFNQEEGFILDDLELAYAPKKDGSETFQLQAWGFGNAEPSRFANLYFRPMAALKLTLTYDWRGNFYELAPDPLPQREEWGIERWKASAVWDGFSWAKLSLNLKYAKRDGDIYKPLYGLREFYPVHNALDETMKEAAFSIETKTLPVHLFFEQAWTWYERKDRWSAAGATAITHPTDPDLLAGVDTSQRKDKIDQPTSRLMANYRNDVVEVAGSVLYSKADLDSVGPKTTSFDIGGGAIGRLNYVDNLVGSASQDTLAGALNVGVALGEGWLLRASGDYRRQNLDSALLGQRLLTAGPVGAPPIVVAWENYDAWRLLHVKDEDYRFGFEKRSAAWSAWAEGVWTSRTVQQGAVDPKRTSNGYVLGGSWNPNSKFSVTGEYERGSFSQYIFRTEPDKADRFSLRVNSRLGHGWQLSLRGRFETGSNPAEVSKLGYHSDAYGIAANYDTPGGKAGYGFSVDHTGLTTRTDIVLPAGQPALSLYDTNTWIYGANGHVDAGRVSFQADWVYWNDRGSTWPVRSWTAGLKATIRAAKGIEFDLFGRYRYFNESLTSLNDYDASRYGLIIRWRF
jgi:hypothetical protein